jgi:hypothetical protein
MTRTHSRIEKPQIGAFADHHSGAKGKDTGKGDVEIRDDAQRRRLDHMTAKTVEGARAGAAGVDKGGRSAAPRHFGRIDAERGPAPIDMSVEIDQPGHHEQPPHIDDLGPNAWRIAPDLDHLSVAKGNVADPVATIRRIDDAPAFKDQFRHMLASGKTRGATSYDELSITS